MSRAKTERLLNLTIALLHSRRALTRDQIRTAVPGYPEQGEAFDRMFERDKEELRDMGIPVALIDLDPWFDDEVGYRIDRDVYAVPEVSFSADELAVLALAARTWTHASLSAPASYGLLKLSAYEDAGDEAGRRADDAPEGVLTGLEPRLGAGEPAFFPLWQALRSGREVSFDYRRGDGSPPARRSVAPWGLTSRHGHWYLVGHDRDRAATRVFRVSRIIGAVGVTSPPATVQVPVGIDIRAMVDAQSSPREPISASVLLRGAAGGWLRSQATSCAARGPDSEVSLVVTDLDELADHIAGLGADAIALRPVALRDAVIARLVGAFEAHR